jgi:hypothetical protein
MGSEQELGLGLDYLIHPRSNFFLSTFDFFFFPAAAARRGSLAGAAVAPSHLRRASARRGHLPPPVWASPSSAYRGTPVRRGCRPSAMAAARRGCPLAAVRRGRPLAAATARLSAVLRYLRGTSSHCLFYAHDSPLQLHAYSDSTWASDPTDRRSITGCCILPGSSPLAWKSKKQAVVSRSSTKAELRALAATTSDIVWLRWLLADFGIPCDAPTPLLCDNTGAIQIDNDPVKHELTKHIGVDAFFTRSHCHQKLLIYSMCPLSCS